MAKLLYVVLDGAPDGFDARKSSLRSANTPHLDMLARHGACGLAYTVRPGIAPESDVAVMSLLGYDPEKYYTGRGPLEALGTGIDLQPGDLALRANFATIDPSTMRIIDRRAGRSLSSEEARALASSIDSMRLDNGRATAIFRSTIGHRGVLVLRHTNMKLSAAISNTDPAYERVGLISHARRSFEPYVQKAVPLIDDPAARKAADLVNEFTFKAIEILDKHPINLERRRKGLLPANAILLRDAGDRPPQAPPFEEVFGFAMASIVEMVVERGIARALGLHDIEVSVEGSDKASLLVEEARRTAEALKRYGGVYVHLKGPDEPGHDGDFRSKITSIEIIDKYFLNKILNLIDIENTVILVTSDHSTPWHLRAHSDDPVPYMISHPLIKSNPGRFDEITCKEKMSLPLLDRGYKILPTVLDFVRSKLFLNIF